MTVLSLVLLMSMMAFAIDVGNLMLVRTQLQVASDSAALAAATVIADGKPAVLESAQHFAGRHTAEADPVYLVPHDDIVIGRWDRDSATFTPLPDSELRRANAVQVTARVNQQRGNAAHLMFGNAIGTGLADVQARAIALRERRRCGRIAGVEEIRMNGGRTDSYDSSLGPYGLGNVGDQGHICSNGEISLSSNAQVHGDVTTGPEGSVSQAPGAVITGETKKAKKPIDYPAIDPGDAAVYNDNGNLPAWAFDGKDIKLVESQQLELPPGTYYIPGSVQISGSAAILVSGPTTIYVAGNADITGSGIVNRTGAPSYLQLFLMGQRTKFAGSAALHADIYGPATDVRITGGGGIYGAIVGKTLTLSGDNAAIHYDEALGALNKHAPAVSLLVQ